MKFEKVYKSCYNIYVRLKKKHLKEVEPASWIGTPLTLHQSVSMDLRLNYHRRNYCDMWLSGKRYIKRQSKSQPYGRMMQW